jgi:uncharacterized protein (DUF849 family)
MEITDQAVKAYEEGAAVAHIHDREPVTKALNPRVDLYREVSERIRDKCAMIDQLATGREGP